MSSAPGSNEQNDRHIPSDNLSITDFSQQWARERSQGGGMGGEGSIEFDDAAQKYLDNGNELTFKYDGQTYRLKKQGDNYIALDSSGHVIDSSVQINNDFTVEGYLEVGGIEGIGRQDRLYIGQHGDTKYINMIVERANLDIMRIATPDAQEVLTAAELIQLADVGQIKSNPLDASTFVNLTRQEQLSILASLSDEQKSTLAKDLGNFFNQLGEPTTGLSLHTPERNAVYEAAARLLQSINPNISTAASTKVFNLLLEANVSLATNTLSYLNSNVEFSEIGKPLINSLSGQAIEFFFAQQEFSSKFTNQSISFLMDTREDITVDKFLALTPGNQSAVLEGMRNSGDFSDEILFLLASSMHDTGQKPPFNISYVPENEEFTVEPGGSVTVGGSEFSTDLPPGNYNRYNDSLYREVLLPEGFLVKGKNELFLAVDTQTGQFLLNKDGLGTAGHTYEELTEVFGIPADQVYLPTYTLETVPYYGPPGGTHFILIQDGFLSVKYSDVEEYQIIGQIENTMHAEYIFDK